jgi:hypothetical protein
MKQFIGILLFTAFFAGLTSCSETTVPKPDKLIPKEKFEKMMFDIYLVEGFNTSNDKTKQLKKINQTNLYYSVLKKYSVSDTVFIRSIIYYSSFPKEYEKMQIKIIDDLNESEQQFKPKAKLKVGPE